MLRFIARLFVALAALLAMRLFFAAARRASGGGAPSRSRVTGAGGGGAGGAAPRPASRSNPSRAPRIDRSTAEDVPFEELEREHAPRA
jgi:hypothetical protein